MDKYPSNRKTVYIEDIDKEVALRELTEGYIATAHKDPEFDTARNALKMCGLTDEEVDEIGMSVSNKLYGAIVDLTYPDARRIKDEAIASGTYKEPTDAELKDAKKN